MTSPSDLSTGGLSFLDTPQPRGVSRPLNFQGRADPALRRQLFNEFTDMDVEIAAGNYDEKVLFPQDNPAARAAQEQNAAEALPLGAPYGPALPPDYMPRLAATSRKSFTKDQCWGLIKKEYPNLIEDINSTGGDTAAKLEALLTNLICREILRRKRGYSYYKKQHLNIWKKINYASRTASTAQNRYKKIYNSKKRQDDWMNHLRSKAYAFK